MTLIKQEKLVFILVVVYIREYLCVFTKLFTEDWCNNRKCTALFDSEFGNPAWEHYEAKQLILHASSRTEWDVN